MPINFIRCKLRSRIQRCDHFTLTHAWAFRSQFRVGKSGNSARVHPEMKKTDRRTHCFRSKVPGRIRAWRSKLVAVIAARKLSRALGFKTTSVTATRSLARLTASVQAPAHGSAFMVRPTSLGSAPPPSSQRPDAAHCPPNDPRSATGRQSLCQASLQMFEKSLKISVPAISQLRRIGDLLAPSRRRCNRHGRARDRVANELEGT
jgi:hypothetical protein